MDIEDGAAGSSDEEAKRGNESDEEEDDDELVRHIKQQQKQLREQRLKHQSDAWEQPDEDEKEGTGDSLAEDDALANDWGGKKSLYYGGDEGGIEPGDEEADEDAEREEEEEAIRLQRESAKQLAAEHFGPGWNLDSLRNAKQSSEGERALEDECDNDLVLDDEDEADTDQAVRRHKDQSLRAMDTSKMTEEEKQAALETEAPELSKLLNELKSSMHEVRNRIEPTLERVKSNELNTSGGVSYLEAKHLLLLSYCEAIAFYVLMKAEGRDVTNHPVMHRLVELKTFIEKAKPIDKKMQHQIDKAIEYSKRQENRPSQPADRAQGAELDDEAESDGEDAGMLAYKPRPEMLIPKQSVREDGGSESFEDRDSDIPQRAQLYRPPKLNPASMENSSWNANSRRGVSNETSRKDEDEDEDDAEEGKTRRKGDGKPRSQTLQALAQEIEEVPEEEGARGPDESTEQQRREAEMLAERAQEEEERFTRVPLSKEEKKKVKSASRKVGMTSQLGDFGDDVSDLVKMAKKEEREQSEKPSVASIANAAGAGINRKSTVSRSGEADVPRKGDLGEQRAAFDAAAASRDAKRSRETPAELDANEDNEFIGGLEEDELYKQAQEAAARKKARKSTSKSGAIPAEETTVSYDERRNITNEMQANRGLTPHRKKETKNPRKRLRSKHKKALVKRRGQVPDQKAGSAAAYGGEESGIKKKTAKSRHIVA